MARLPRFAVPGLPQHIVQRGNNRQRIFNTAADYDFFRRCLMQACAQHGCEVHAYAFMTNHTHLLMTPHSASGIGRTMQSVGTRYVRYFNDVARRTGTLWEGRYHATLVQTDQYLLTCYRYIELNPVRAGMARHPADYQWSSHRANAFAEADPLVVPHDLYRSLDRETGSAHLAYRALFTEAIPDSTLEEIRAATNNGWALGSERFRRQIEAITRRRASPLPRGPRPGPRASGG